MRLLTGDETGLVKDVWIENSSAGILGGVLLQDRAFGTTALGWGVGDGSLLCGRNSGVVETWERSTAMSGSMRSQSWKVVSVARGLPSAPVAVVALPEVNAHVAFCRSGDICVTNAASAAAGDKAKYTSKPTLKNNAKKESGSGEPGAAAAAEPGETVAALGGDVLRSRNWKDGNARSAANHHLSAAAVDGSRRFCVVGGMEHDAALVDLATGQTPWQARNVGHDHLELRRPVWVTGLEFLRNGPGGTPDPAGQCFAAATAFQELRLYDARADSRRPTGEVVGLGGELGLTCVALTRDGFEAVVGNKGGDVQLVDLRTLKESGRFMGSMGSVRGLSVHPTLPYLAAVGLDRTARVFNLKTHKLVSTSYLKQRLTAVLFDSEGVVLNKDGDGGGDEERSDEDESSDEDDDSEGGVQYYQDDGGALSSDESDEGDNSADERKVGKEGENDEEVEDGVDEGGVGGGGEEEEEEEEDSDDDDDDDDDEVEERNDGDDSESDLEVPVQSIPKRTGSQGHVRAESNGKKRRR